MTTDRAGPEGTIESEERQKHLEARMGLFGFYAAIMRDISPPWMPEPPVLNSMLERARELQAARTCGSPPETP